MREPLRAGIDGYPQASVFGLIVESEANKTTSPVTLQASCSPGRLATMIWQCSPEGEVAPSERCTVSCGCGQLVHSFLQFKLRDCILQQTQVKKNVRFCRAARLFVDSEKGNLGEFRCGPGQRSLE